MSKDIYSPLTPSKTEENDTNSTKNKEVEYDWGKHPNSVKALKKHQYPKGVSGNIMGRKPTFESLAKQLKDMGADEVMNWNGKESKGTKKQLVLERIWKDAMMGDMKKIQLLAWLGCLD